MFLIVCALGFFSKAVHAQSLSDFLEEETAKPEIQKTYTINELADGYYTRCISANRQKELASYVQSQCACTAAKLPEFMSVDEVLAALTETPDTELQNSRILLNAYIPCLENSVQDFVFDECARGKYKNELLTNPRNFCACLSTNMAEYVAQERAENVFFGVRNFRAAASEEDASYFSQIINDAGFIRNFDYHTPRCIRIVEYNR